MAAPQAPDLSATAHPELAAIFYVVLGLYCVSLLAALVWPKHTRWLVLVGLVVHVAGMVGRGWIIGFFPLTGKMESFSMASLSLALVTVATWRANRPYLTVLLGLTVAALYVSLQFPLEMRYPPPLMWTIWYPLHVPLSFLAYGLWAAGAAGALAWLLDRDPRWLRRIDQRALQGLGLWSVGMICGGIWGVLAWGAYFLWDPKVIWSVILWFHYAAFMHLRLTPSLVDRPWIRPVLAAVGLFWVFVAYVGTSFYFGGSSHSF